MKCLQHRDSRWWSRRVASLRQGSSILYLDLNQGKNSLCSANSLFLPFIYMTVWTWSWHSLSLGSGKKAFIVKLIYIYITVDVKKKTFSWKARFRKETLPWSVRIFLFSTIYQISCSGIRDFLLVLTMTPFFAFSKDIFCRFVLQILPIYKKFSKISAPITIMLRCK